ncbi:MAG: aminotransferase class I and II [Chloroflexi bacterium AL-W]|nr:aminotransferase class I and II [Chloroflexi bacterium AL-N1]NOK64873.1 aminotransferase class I and II [Chloroflexi bacterium AL-N10]NOK76643.1 aminotransferase class I and II [Chloroflexi bacterium AL-N5]NOK80128.1 aminotransferase class I and II [Chloroflexi bacterium AL-W]NOK86641.1 aminotransferase class I and II [Chloroflexi bacterium AL-N15]
MRTIIATRYITPLREGGSLPALIEGDDEEMYVLKFRGAGQGPKALIAELIAGEIGRALGLSVPELVFVELDAGLGRNERDAEIKELIEASAGLNLALGYLSGSLGFDPVATTSIDTRLASEVVWFDAYVTNVDRTARNTNMLFWNKQLWLIDHGATLYFHHDWRDYLERSRSSFAPVKDHVLLRFAAELSAVDTVFRGQLTVDILQRIVNLIPQSWLAAEPGFPEPNEHRDAYVAFLQSRLESSHVFVEEAIRVRTQLL